MREEWEKLYWEKNKVITREEWRKLEWRKLEGKKN